MLGYIDSFLQISQTTKWIDNAYGSSMYFEDGEMNLYMYVIAKLGNKSGKFSKVSRMFSFIVLVPTSK